MYTNRLIHCFGNPSWVWLTQPQQVSEVLLASQTEFLILNTHNIQSVSSLDELPIGYSDVTYGDVKPFLPKRDYTILININAPTNADEAVYRTLRGVELVNKPAMIKLEVLTPDHRYPDNPELLKAARHIKAQFSDLGILPLIYPDIATFEELQELECPMIRLLGSAIGSFGGIEVQTKRVIEQIVRSKRVSIMLDGGIGTVQHALEAISLGCDCVLVNSCIFKKGVNYLSVLQQFNTVLNSSLDLNYTSKFRIV